MKNIYILLAVCSMALFSSCGFNVFDDVYQTEQTSDYTVFDENGYPVYQQGEVVVLDRNRRNQRTTRTTRGSRDNGYNGCPGEQPRSRQPRTIPQQRPQPQSTPRPRPQPQQQNSRPAPTQTKSQPSGGLFGKATKPNNN